MQTLGLYLTLNYHNYSSMFWLDMLIYLQAVPTKYVTRNHIKLCIN